MVYTPTYEATDFIALVFDLIGTIVAAIITQAENLVLLMIALLFVGLLGDLIFGTFGIFKRMGIR